MEITIRIKARFLAQSGTGGQRHAFEPPRTLDCMTNRWATNGGHFPLVLLASEGNIRYASLTYMALWRAWGACEGIYGSSFACLLYRGQRSHKRVQCRGPSRAAPGRNHPGCFPHGPIGVVPLQVLQVVSSSSSWACTKSPAGDRCLIVL